MQDRTLITSGSVGVGLAALCCFTPLLAIILGAIGLTAWLAKADYVALLVLSLSLVVLGLGLYRKHLRAR